MKFIRSLVTDFVADNARFVYLETGPSGGAEKVQITKENAEEHLHEETRERLEYFDYETNYLAAATEANHEVDKKLGACWEAMKGLSEASTPEDYKRIAKEYLVSRADVLPTAEMRKMYRTEMFGTLMDKLAKSGDELGISNEQISQLLLDGSASVYTYPEKEQSVTYSLQSASRMIHIDSDKSGINVTEWVEGGKSIMEYKDQMEASNVKASVDLDGNLVIDGQAYDIKGCEILTGAGMANYPKEYLSKFLFQNLIFDGNKVMARVENGCKGNLATFVVDRVVEDVMDKGAGDGNGKENEKGDDVVDGEKKKIETPEIIEDGCNDCDREAEELWNGLAEGDGAALKAFNEMTGQTLENIDEAREAFLKLYGRKEMYTRKEIKALKEGEQPIDGFYTVLEKHFNKKAGIPLLESITELCTNRGLEKSFIKAGYSPEMAKKIEDAFMGREEEFKVIAENAQKFAAETEDRNAGATVEFITRLGVGAAIATIMAAALGTGAPSLPLVLAGAPVARFRTGIKRFDKTPGTDDIYALFTNPSATAEDYDALLGGQLDPGKTYTEIQRDALVSVDMQNFLANDAVDANVTLKRGPYATPMLNLSSEEAQVYQEQREGISEVKDNTAEVLSSLAKNGYYFAEGADVEGTQAAKAKAFRLTRWPLNREVPVNKGDKTVNMTEKNAFDFFMEKAQATGRADVKRENYMKAMYLLVEQFNDVASEELDMDWGPDKRLTLEGLDEAFKKPHEFNLGKLPDKEGFNFNREVCVKFTPESAGQAKNTSARGKWEMYIKADGQILEQTRKEYRSANELIGVRDKKFSSENIEDLGYDKTNLLSRKEQRIIMKRLDYFDLMVGQMAQLNETKDQMTLSTWNQERVEETARIKNRFEAESRDNGTRVETQEEYQYRVAVGAKLAKFDSFAEFEEKIGIKGILSPDVMEKIKKVYDHEPGSLSDLVKDQKFQVEMATLTQEMENVKSYLEVQDLDECAKCAKKNMHLSAETAMRQSTYKTVSFGEAYLLYLAGEGLLGSTVVEELRTYEEIYTETYTETYMEPYTETYTTGGKVGMPGMEIEMQLEREATREVERQAVRTVEERMQKSVQNWANKGWLDTNLRRAIIAVTGGAVTNAAIDRYKNQPEK